MDLAERESPGSMLNLIWLNLNPLMVTRVLWSHLVGFVKPRGAHMSSNSLCGLHNEGFLGLHWPQNDLKGIKTSLLLAQEKRNFFSSGFILNSAEATGGCSGLFGFRSPLEATRAQLCSPS